MKKILLSFFMCMLAIIGMQAAEVTFNFAFSGTIDGLSTAKEKKSSDTFTIDGYTFDAYSCYKSSNNSAKYLMVEKLSLGGKLTLPSFSGKKVTAVSVLTGTGASTSVKVGLYKGEELIEEKTLNAQGANFTYNVEDDDATGTRYILKVTNDKNAQFQNIVITYETTGEGGGDEPVIEKLADPTFSVLAGDVIRGIEVTITAPEGSTLVYTVNDGVKVREDGVNFATVTIDKKTTIEAYAIQDGFEDSEVVTATYTIEEPAMPEAGVWTLVDDASTLVAGDKIVIAAADSDHALSTNQRSSNRGAVAVTKNGNLLNITADVQVLTLEAGTATGTWAFNTGSGYLYAASSSDNQLKTKQELDAKGSFIINIEDKVTTVEACENSRNKMQYNYNNDNPPLFSCYASYDLVNRQYVSLYRFESVPFEENIKYGMYYLSPGAWDEPATWYAAQFVNANTSAINWVYGLRKENEGNVGVYYGLEDTENAYTHIMFCAMYGDAPEFDEEKGELKNVEDAKAKMIWENVVACSEYLTYTVPEENCITVFKINDVNGKGEWVTIDLSQEVPTALDRVEMAGGIGYAYGVVSAEGAIEVYNVNGAVVARGNDTIDLRGLGRGVYIIRNGNQVRKVVR